MIEIYLAAAAFGVVLVGANVLLGGADDLGEGGDADHDFDADHDADCDVDHGHEVDQFGTDLAHAGDGPWLPWTSLRFWSFFAAAFGVTGALLSLAGMEDLWSALIAAPTGFAVGSGASWVLRQIRVDRVSGDVTLDRYVGEEGKVVLSVRVGGVGKIRITTRSGLMELPARTSDGHDLGVGDRVLVAAVRDGVADVTRLATAPVVREGHRETEG